VNLLRAGVSPVYPRMWARCRVAATACCLTLLMRTLPASVSSAGATQPRLLQTGCGLMLLPENFANGQGR
jgi:hypothetical protein